VVGVFAVAGEVGIEVVGAVFVEGVGQLRRAENALHLGAAHAGLDAGDVGIGEDVALNDVGFVEEGGAAAAAQAEGKQAGEGKSHGISCR